MSALGGSPRVSGLASGLALAATGLPGIHFHDLRHAGNLLVADAGANLRERLGYLCRELGFQ